MSGQGLLHAGCMRKEAKEGENQRHREWSWLFEEISDSETDTVSCEKKKEKEELLKSFQQFIWVFCLLFAGDDERKEKYKCKCRTQSARGQGEDRSRVKRSFECGFVKDKQKKILTPLREWLKKKQEGCQFGNKK